MNSNSNNNYSTSNTNNILRYSLQKDKSGSGLYRLFNDEINNIK